MSPEGAAPLGDSLGGHVRVGVGVKARARASVKARAGVGVEVRVLGFGFVSHLRSAVWRVAAYFARCASLSPPALRRSRRCSARRSRLGLRADRRRPEAERLRCGHWGSGCSGSSAS